MARISRIRWAPRLRPQLLARLYEADAQGFRDVELCDDVGSRLLERCHSLVRVARGEVACPDCGSVFRVATEGTSACPSPRCGWQTTADVYRTSVRHHYAWPGRARKAFETFCSDYPRARSYPEKLVRIDQLIHSFHVAEATEAPTKSVASKLLEGNKNEVVRFLDRLSSRDPDAKRRWRATVSGTLHARIVTRDE